MRIFCLALVIFTTAAGCVAVDQPMMDDPRFAPTYPTARPAIPESNGSLFSANSYLSLYNDPVARRVGDIINVRLNERTESKKSANTKIKKDTDNTLVEPIILGKKITSPPTSGSFLNTISHENEFDGRANSDQSNSLLGSIAVTISEVLPNGVFVVRGAKWLRLNQGDAFIRITGMIRAVDIDADNSIDSTKIANARITYSGKGAVADSNQIGWLARFFINPAFGY